MGSNGRHRPTKAQFEPRESDMDKYQATFLLKFTSWRRRICTYTEFGDIVTGRQAERSGVLLLPLRPHSSEDLFRIFKKTGSTAEPYYLQSNLYTV